jgi:hypothetical protein
VAINRIFKTMAFEPEAIAIMAAAYEDALRVLLLANRQDPITELVARKIIDVAHSGESDPARIREQALRELGIPPGSSAA